MSSLRIAENMEIGMFTPVYIQEKSVCYSEEQADGTKDREIRN